MKIENAKSGDKVTITSGPAAGREVVVGPVQAVDGKFVSVSDPVTGETQTVRADLEVS